MPLAWCASQSACQLHECEHVQAPRSNQKVVRLLGRLLLSCY